MPTVAGIADVLIAILVIVAIFDVANLKNSNAHKDGGRPDHDPRIVIVSDVADPPMPAITRMAHCPPPHTPQGGGERSE